METITTHVEVTTRDGRMPTDVFRPAGAASLPAAIFYMDAGGIRPSMTAMARRLASNGFVVALPDLYYRQGKIAPFDFKTVFNGGPERDRLMGLIATLNADKVNSDTAGLLAHLDTRPDLTGKAVGATGYCMGGRYALLAAAAFPERFAAVAAFHASRLAVDQPDSPHRLADRIRARVYVAPAGIDPGFTPEERARLESALTQAKVRHTIEVYEGVHHGYAVPDFPVFDSAAAERHWTRLVALFRESLPA